MPSHLVELHVERPVEVSKSLHDLRVNVWMGPPFGFTQAMGLAAALGLFETREALGLVEVEVFVCDDPLEPLRSPARGPALRPGRWSAALRSRTGSGSWGRTAASCPGVWRRCRSEWRSTTVSINPVVLFLNVRLSKEGMSGFLDSVCV